MFPAIAVANGFRKTQEDLDRENENPSIVVGGKRMSFVEAAISGQLEHGSLPARGQQMWGHRGTKIMLDARGRFVATCDGSLQHGLNGTIDDLSKWHLPTLQWNKQLGPEADRDYLDMLGVLTEKGFPIPLRMLAAAGGVDLNDIMTGMDDDMALRKVLADKMKEIAELSSDVPGMGEVMSSISKKTLPMRRVGMKKRDFTIAGEMLRTGSVDEDGNRVNVSKRQAQLLDNRFNKKLAASLAAMGEINTKKGQEAARRLVVEELAKRHYPMSGATRTKKKPVMARGLRSSAAAKASDNSSGNRLAAVLKDAFSGKSE
jgi:hypothetical protein